LVDIAAAHDGGQAIVSGDVVNTAARLQAEAPPGGVLVCAATHAAARTEIRFAAQPALTLRGPPPPTEVWLALAAVPPQLDEDVADGVFRPIHGLADPEFLPTHGFALPQFVGRDHELGLLTSALHQVISAREP